MPKSGGVDSSELEEFQKKFHDLATQNLNPFYDRAGKAVAARYLSLVIPATPVGWYDKPVHFTTKDGRTVSFTPQTGKLGGTLRWGWIAKKRIGASQPGAGQIMAYAKGLPVTHQGNTHKITIANHVKYAGYVEYGHRTANHKGWVEGQFFATKVENALRPRIPRILENEFERYAREKLK